MVINCFRCAEPIESPNATNADYIIAADTVATEEREVIVAVHHNAGTLATLAQMEETEEYADSDLVQITDGGDSKYDVDEIVDKREFEATNKLLLATELSQATGASPVTMTRLTYPDLVVADKDYTRTVAPTLGAAHEIADLIRVEPDVREVAVQKTGIICPACYDPADMVIWGVHK